MWGRKDKKDKKAERRKGSGGTGRGGTGLPFMGLGVPPGEPLTIIFTCQDLLLVSPLNDVRGGGIR